MLTMSIKLPSQPIKDSSSLHFQSFVLVQQHYDIYNYTFPCPNPDILIILLTRLSASLDTLLSSIPDL